MSLTKKDVETCVISREILIAHGFYEVNSASIVAVMSKQLGRVVTLEEFQQSIQDGCWVLEDGRKKVKS